MNLHVRPAEPDDAPEIAAIYDPLVEHTAITFETEPVGTAGMEARIREVSARLPYLVGTIDDRVVGYCYASPHRHRAAYRWAVETSIFVHPGAQGRGVGRTLYASLIVALEELGYTTAWAGITLPNPSSVALHRGLGFTEVGVYEGVGYKSGAWRDVLWLRLKLAEPRVPPTEPLSWSPQRPRVSSA